MLLFISDGYWKIRMTYEFQYISCYSLSERSFRPGKCYHVSIHLMLLFIIKASNEFVKMAKFQYISCYSLSTFWTYMNTLEQRFNTSHVTLYRRDVGTWTWGWCVSIHLMLLFISQRMNRIIRYLSFNTSHVTLYHWRGFKRLYRWEVSIHLMLLFIVSMAKQSGIGSRFNTSHVTLYLRHGCIS